MTKESFHRSVVVAILLGSIGCAVLLARAAEPLRPVQTIPLPGVEGRIDHFGFDAKGQRLFVAALGNNTVEVVDIAAGMVIGRIKDLQAPQGIALARDFNRLAVANDTDGSVRLFDAATFKPVHVIDLKDDADNVRYDADARRFWVGYGNGGLAAIDPESGKVLADVKLDAHPESFQLESKGKRIFVNVPGARQVAVVDRDKGAVIAKWGMNEAQANFPMALDEANRRLFIGCRRPAKLLILDMDSGKSVASVDIVGDTDDLFYDAANKRIYVTGGEARITVVAQAGADSYRVAGQISTAAGARTSYFVPSTGRLYVAVPHRNAQGAELRVFQGEAAK
jgi:DNA-binding beta-propeller fold protein YncE